jgi:sec-independent protein translocase protein TatC
VLPGAIKILVVQFGHDFTPMITIEDYSSFFLSIILGLGISFELPILIFFLAMFGIVSPRFLWKNAHTMKRTIRCAPSTLLVPTTARPQPGF